MAIDYWHSTFTKEITIKIPHDDIPAFKELIQRGANLWPDAPPAIKEFADVATTGSPLQDYYQQANQPREKEGNNEYANPKQV